VGTLRPGEEPPHTLRLNTRAKASTSPDALGWAHQVMPGHRVWSRAVRDHGHPGRQTVQPREDAGATRGPTARPGAWQWTLILSHPSVRYSFPYS